MAFVWFGWGQEDPLPRLRAALGVGSGLGALFAGVFGYAVARTWNSPSALEGKYAWFGVLVLVEVVAAGGGCLVLARRRRGRWMAWWVALVVALHFIPLALLLCDWSLAVLGVLQVVGLGVLGRRLRSADTPTSRLVGPFMGVTLLAFGVLSAAVFLVAHGSPV